MGSLRMGSCVLVCAFVSSVLAAPTAGSTSPPVQGRARGTRVAPPSGWSVTNPAAPSWSDQSPSNFPQAMADVSCATPAFCVAVGQTFTDTAGGSVGELVGDIETDTGGAWSPSQAPFPPGWPTGTGANGAQLALTGVSCPAAGWCVASGEAISPTSGDVDVAVTLSQGTWTTAVLPTPADLLEPDENDEDNDRT